VTWGGNKGVTLEGRHVVAQLVETQFCKLEGHVSNPDEVNFFNLPNPSSCTIALGSTQPLTEMSTRNLLGGKGQQTRKADMTDICELIV
jgi:hypothetical protein